MTGERVALIGYGAIGRVFAERHLATGGELAAVLVRERTLSEARAGLPAGVTVVTTVEGLLAAGPSLAVECAGQEAVHAYAEAALAAGISFMAASTGALAARGFLDRLLASARGGARLIVPAGAIAGLDGLGALKEAGLRSVTYTSTKPPPAWRGTPAEDALDLFALNEATTFFDGPAREAALSYPKNANLAATVALAGLGLDRTRVRLVADPAARGNTGRVEAESDAGTLLVEMAGAASANPKTSASVAFSLLHAVRSRTARLVI